jgi:hypothetical protein
MRGERNGVERSVQSVEGIAGGDMSRKEVFGVQKGMAGGYMGRKDVFGV